MSAYILNLDWSQHGEGLISWVLDACLTLWGYNLVVAFPKGGCLVTG